MLLSNAFRPDPRVLKEAEGLASSGYKITVICWDRAREMAASETLQSGVKIVRIQNVRSSYGIGPRQILILPRFWGSTIGIINQHQPDVIHCHDFDTLPIGLIYGKRHHIPVIYDAHEYYADLVRPRLNGLLGWVLYNSIRIAEKYASTRADAVITVDESLGAIFRNLNPQVLVIGHYPQKSMAELANPIFNRSNLILLYAGRISTDRGALLYIDILRCLRDLGLPARLKLVGVYTPSSEEKSIKQYALGVENFIENLGWIPYQQIRNVYRSADIGLTILQPESRYIAALPVKLFEYMANGLPVIASNFPLISSVINETHCGELVNPLAQPIEIARVIERWWNDPAIPRLLGENGRQSVLLKYNWECLGEKLSDLYVQMINK